MDSSLLQTVIYLPFFALALALYYRSERSVWKGQLIECLALANGVGAFFLVIIEVTFFPPFNIDVVTFFSIIIIGLNAFYTGKIKKPQKPIIGRKDSTKKS
ncbi:MAG: hypothetical protein A2W22_01565 [Candidatus Levybacteria bacterium RBG_16_35_11]|nr:MAG: hypothetical protein A2W22_01565 [Candidatus Levybacteria bacterium RBG_16_35_11]